MILPLRAASYNKGLFRGGGVGGDVGVGGGVGGGVVVVGGGGGVAVLPGRECSVWPQHSPQP